MSHRTEAAHKQELAANREAGRLFDELDRLTAELNATIDPAVIGHITTELFIEQRWNADRRTLVPRLILKHSYQDDPARFQEAQ